MNNKMQLIVSDPPYIFSDNLTMSDVKRGAMTQYSNNGLTIDQLKSLRVPEVTADDAVLALWVPSSIISSGLEIMDAWGFRQTQTFIWVKNKIDPWKELKKSVKAGIKELLAGAYTKEQLIGLIDNFSLNDTMAFYMGRIFRQAHEIALIGVKGKVYPHVKNKSQRSVLFDINKGHSSKPEGFQDRLELIFPDFTNRLEMFARRDRPGWRCCGLECPSTMNESIDVSLEKLISSNINDLNNQGLETLKILESQSKTNISDDVSKQMTSDIIISTETAEEDVSFITV
ncbi:MAG: MT-A70 family methyltransferase [Bacteroidales bacterium]|jgi:N6-adenosine-specific RNA methylase IME4